MIFRYFLVLGVIAFAAVNVVNAEEYEVTDRQAFRIVLSFLKDAFKSATINCLQGAAGACAHLWNHPIDAVNCARNYITGSHGACALG